MIGRICFWILKRAISHDRQAWEKIVSKTRIHADKGCYVSDIRTMQGRIYAHWGYMPDRSPNEKDVKT